MKILLLSAYDAGSHRYWREGLVAHLPEHEWVVETLPPRHFSWRVRGNSLYWALEKTDVLHEPYDALVATSMVDLSALRGLVPHLARIPTLVYFHENQFVYPLRSGARRTVTPALTSVYTALCADQVAFNSAFNRDTFLEGTDQLLGQMPDFVPGGVAARVRERSLVLPVPLREGSFEAGPALPHNSGPLTIVWNHRWEYDKAPDAFFEALFELSRRGAEFRLHVVGQRFRQAPSIFEVARTRLKAHVETWGFLEDRAHYQALLEASDVVVSTATHEFQGLAVLEAMAAGCHPLVPDRLAYKDFIPQKWRYPSSPDDPAAEHNALLERLTQMCAQPEHLRQQPVPPTSSLSWTHLSSSYRRVLQGLEV